MSAIQTIHQRLCKSGQTVAVAESCTGGLLSAMLTSLPGSSAYFLLGIVSYGNRSKSRILRIPEKLIRRNGAVSDAVCRRMASASRRLAGSDLGMGVTGIAGPAGAVKGKPAGTVYIAVASGEGASCRRFLFKGSRSRIRESSCRQALKMLAQVLKEKR